MISYAIVHAVNTGVLPNVDSHPPFRELMKHKHKAYTLAPLRNEEEVVDPLIVWLVMNIPEVEDVYTFMAIPVRSSIEYFLTQGHIACRW